MFNLVFDNDPKEDTSVLHIARQFWAEASCKQRMHTRRRIDVGLPRKSSKASPSEIGWIRARRKAVAALAANASTPTETADLPEGAGNARKRACVCE